MRLFRLYTGDDGQSHLEALDIPFEIEGTRARAPIQPATGILFSRYEPALSGLP